MSFSEYEMKKFLFLEYIKCYKLLEKTCDMFFSSENYITIVHREEIKE